MTAKEMPIVQKRTIDIVMPAFNEASCLRRTIAVLFEHLADLDYRFELIIVDDGSDDETSEVVKECSQEYPIRLIRLTRNFGKETAILAGLDVARGDATVIMDADLQHPVELIGPFIEKWEAGFQCVYGMRADRRDESWLKRLCAKVFYLGLNAGSRVRIVPNALDFRLLDRAAVQALCSIRERVRFTKGLYAWLGFSSIGIPFAPPARAEGETHFDGGALVQLGWDGITSFSDLPLRLAEFIGGGVAGLSLLYAFYIFVRTIIFGVDVPGWATLTVAITFLGGLQLLFLGIIGEYVRSVFIETKRRPNYLVAEVADSRDSKLQDEEPLHPGVADDEPKRREDEKSPARPGRIAAV